MIKPIGLKSPSNEHLCQKLNEVISLINKPVETTNEQLTKEELKRLHTIIERTQRGYLPMEVEIELDSKIYTKLSKLIV